jgi:hypothetical protein
MRIFQCPAAYREHLLDAIERALEEGRRDRACRADEAASVRALAEVPDRLVDPAATGQVLIMIGIVQDEEVVQDLLVASARDLAAAVVDRRRSASATPARDLRLVSGGQD